MMNATLIDSKPTNEVGRPIPIDEKLRQEYRDIPGIERGVKTPISFPHYKHRPGFGVKNGLYIEESSGVIIAQYKDDIIEVTLRAEEGLIGRPVTDMSGFGRDHLLSEFETLETGADRAATPNDADMYEALIARMGPDEPDGAGIYGLRDGKLTPLDGLKSRADTYGSHSEAELFIDVCYVAMRVSKLGSMPLQQAQSVGAAVLTSV